MSRGPITPRSVARAVLDRVDKQGAWATPALDGELARAGLDERDRRLTAEIVYGVLRHRTRLDRAIAEHAELKKTPPRVVTALRVAAYQLLFLDRVPPYAAVDDAVAAARDASGPKLGGFVNAVLRKVVAKREPPLPADPRARLEVEYSLPRWILDELDAAGGLAHAAAFAEAAPIVARGNRRRTTREKLIEHFQTAGVTAAPLDIEGHTPMALRLEGLGDPARSPSFLAGLWTVQDAGAQVVAEIAAPRAGQRILDACAGVGGKSTHLAELADDAAVIDAADLNATKLGLCAETASRLGLTSIKRHAVDLLGTALPGPYDLIVLDAPCTGLGVLRRHPDAKWRLVPADVARMAVLQHQLLDAVVKRLAPGGTLVYSVCTFTRAEGPDQISALAQRAGMRIVGEHRTWPPDADAFYLARLNAPG